MLRYVTALFIIFLQLSVLISSPRIGFTELMERSERDLNVYLNARQTAVSQGLPLTIMTPGKVLIDAKGVEDGKVVYAVITDPVNIYNGGHTAFYEELAASYDITIARITYGNGNVTDNTGGIFDPVISRSTADRYIMIPEWTQDKVYLFDAQTGDLVDADFIPTTAPQLQSPKTALQHFSGKYIIVSDQLSDLVQKFDTTGAYIGFYAPSTGVNTAILDNIRGMAYRLNKNLLVTVGSGSSSNTIQQFDSGGVSIGSYITSGLNSPFDILIRTGDVLVTNSSGTSKITKYDPSGIFLSNFYTGADGNFPQQIIQLPGGRIMFAAFSGAGSGLIILDSTGAYVRSLTGVSGTRGAYLLGNGHYLTTNASGVHEIDSVSGTLIRTISTAANFQFITPYNPGVLLGNGNNGVNSPAVFSLEQNFPNPFNPVTNIKFEMPTGSTANLSVYDVSGRLVAELVNEYKPAGSYEISFDASGLSSGVYFYTLKTPSFTESKKMLLTK
jgi:hypothetical protein